MTAGLLAIGAWLLAHPPALALALVALGAVLLLVGLPLAGVRGMVALLAVIDRRKRAETPDPVARDSDVETSTSVDATVPAE